MKLNDDRRRWLALGAAGIAIAGAGAWLSDRQAGKGAGSDPGTANQATNQATNHPPDPAAIDALMARQWPDAKGVPQSMAQFRGKPLVVNFWGSWCPPCIAEMPELSRLRDELAPRGAEFVGLGVDSAEAVTRFATQHPVSYPLLVVGMGVTQALAAWGNSSGSLPFTLVLDANGVVRQRTVGPVDIAGLRSMLHTLLTR